VRTKDVEVLRGRRHVFTAAAVGVAVVALLDARLSLSRLLWLHLVGRRNEDGGRP